ncbi:MAG: SUMF1/EgtB/PvdO family nonheme iron enzyme [Blastocatellia bacterium]
MHCERCNIDFSEGLRYCKWCGEALVDRPRVTSELQTCPSCSAAIQPGWAFCKTCGERLQASPREPVGAVCPRCGELTDPGALNCLHCGEDLTGGRAAAFEKESADTSLIAMCSSCGERLDAGSLYCKACGSAVYSEETPFGGSALLCTACSSYSPFGSRVCRVCGAPFAQGARTVVDRPAFEPPAKQKPNTLPDLDEQELTLEPTPEVRPEFESGAHTVKFAHTEPQQQTPTSRPKSGVDTNLLPGTAGSKSEQQAPTSIMKKGRITSPVDEPDGGAEKPPSGELAQPIESSSDGDTGGPAEPTLEFPLRPVHVADSKPTTGGFGSDPGGAAVGSENRTEIFVSPGTQPASTLQAASADEVRTREFIAPKPPLDNQATREFQAQETAISEDHLRQMDQPADVVEWTDARPLESSEMVAEPGPSQPLPKKRNAVGIASVVVALLVVAGALFAFWWFVFGRSRPPARSAPPVAVESPPPPVTPSKPPAPAVPEGMVAVALGTYTIGRDGADPLEQPEHKIALQPFFIDRSEVTNADYKKFVDATNHKPPTNWAGASPPEGRDHFPVTGVTWQDAADYAAWVGKRLPTEAEWESAARGADGRIYPWGNEFSASLANINQRPDKPTLNKYPAGLKEVGQYPQGASPAGALDMIGNAWEWVADEITLYPGNSEGKLELEPGATYRVIRGGAYDGSKVNDATYRGYLDASQAYPKVGFRCAKNAK